MFVAAVALTGITVALIAFGFWGNQSEYAFMIALPGGIVIVVEAVSLGTVAVLAGRDGRLAALLAGYLGIVVGMGVGLALPVVLGQTPPGEADLGVFSTRSGSVRRLPSRSTSAPAWSPRSRGRSPGGGSRG
jgi:hypothetical protein